MTPTTTTLELPVTGPFDLREVALMGFGHRNEGSFDGVMRLAFCVDDDYESQVGVAVRQLDNRLEVRIEQSVGPPVVPDKVASQVARVVSVDYDGAAYAKLCASDPVLAPVWSVAPGFRPALFYSPYEAAVWSVLSARRSRAQGIRIRERLGAEHGAFFNVAGQPTAAVPTPSRLLTLESLTGLPSDRIPRLHAVAEAVRRGELAVARLQTMAPEDAQAELQRLPGIGPFYSSLIVIRALGLADVLPEEPHVVEIAQQLYGRTLSASEFADLAETWRPYRTWVGVMLRALGDRVLTG